MKWWRQLKQRLTGSIRQRVTASGYAYGAVSVVLGVAAFTTGNNLLLLIVSGMLSMLVVSGVVSRLGLAGLAIDLDLPDHLSARTPALARVRLKNDKIWLPSFSLRLSGTASSGFSKPIYFPVIPAGEAVDAPLTLCFPKRGQYREDSFVLATRFPLGLTERHVEVEIERDIIVYPCVEPQPSFEELLATVEGEVSARSRGRGDDFHRVRPYEHNESARRVDWKATAHTGKLQVREYLRREQPTVEIALDLWTPPEGLDWFERAVDCCAFLSWSLFERNTAFRLRTQRRTMECPDDCDVYDILKFLALVEPLIRQVPLQLDETDDLRILLRYDAGGSAGGAVAAVVTGS